ncbi:uncharacterized protein NDAI_0J00680 [Naumovozyma dairenensis CBS 421]|uniref:PH domain-containing protein n=1 Tax=Naumovozyma dairenensis (strain ATCC 10597 / BCRC 20456 / CBS 421 / NBRC 0211 / NRRL Y-12639) TaxID=1071378 RepID=G0WGN2_NAUDC|nr:hypothetical protein NDAI_0J00680 [Naumovozyma dairenensis CBS 421]CCD26960.1 hypothetical protein NDAI_0J00680 [Naumovozyma dairenensis CBS 421]
MNTSVDDLLKEIDNELENTINNIYQTNQKKDARPEKSNQEQMSKRNLKQGSFLIPLQEIGEDTMDMIVKHNTRKNSIVKAYSNNPTTDVSNTSFNEKRKSITFMDDMNQKNQINDFLTENFNNSLWSLKDEKNNDQQCSTRGLVMIKKLEKKHLKEINDAHTTLSRLVSLNLDNNNELETSSSGYQGDENATIDDQSRNTNTSTTVDSSSLHDLDIIPSHSQDEEFGDYQDSGSIHSHCSTLRKRYQFQKLNECNMKGDISKDISGDKPEDSNNKSNYDEQFTHNEVSSNSESFNENELEEKGSSRNLETATSRIGSLNLDVKAVATGTEIPVLPALPHLDTLSFSDLLNNSMDISNDVSTVSTEPKEPLKPSDYLSIWRDQEQLLNSSLPQENIGGFSPVFSVNSQFTASTNNSRATSMSSRFNTRVVSKSTIYRPQERPTSFIPNEFALPLAKILSPKFKNEDETSPRIGFENKSIPKLFHSTQSVSTKLKKAYNLHKEDSSLKNNVAGEVNEAKIDSEQSLFNNFVNSSPVQVNSPDLIDKSLTSLMTTWDHELESFLEEELGQGVVTFLSDLDDALLTSLGNMDTTEESELKQTSVDEGYLGLTGSVPNSIPDQELFTIFDNDTVPKTPTRKESVKLFDSFHENDEDIILTPPPKEVTRSHVSSPFKVVQSNYIKSQDEDEPLKGVDVPSENMNEGQSGLPELKVEPEQDGGTEVKNVENVEPMTPPVPLKDLGYLYVTLNKISNLALHGIKRHNAKYSLEFNANGEKTRTPWTQLPNDGNIRIRKEFRILMENQDEPSPKLEILLRCQYEKPKNELVGVTEKIPVGKKFLFGKKKYIYKKRYIEKAPPVDDWDKIFGKNGSFATCELVLETKILDQCKFSKVIKVHDMVNKWNYEKNGSHSFMKVGHLEMSLCYLERSLNEETFPSSLLDAQKIIKRYNEKQNIQKEGYMLQEGGDIEGAALQKRLFKLHGTELVGYHEISGKPRIRINMLKVKEVVGTDRIGKDGEVFTSTADSFSLGTSIQLIFENDEKLTLVSEDSDAGKGDWFNTLSRVVSLNASHQPWIKKYASQLVST